MNDLDETDWKILGALQGDGRVSNRALAQTVALSPAPCWRRVRELERNGVIRGYAALLDPVRVGIGLLAFAHVSLENHHPETVASFDAALAQWPEVLECHATSGEYDYMLKVVAADLAGYEAFVSNKLLQVGVVRTVNSSFSLRQKKNTTVLPLANAPA